MIYPHKLLVIALLFVSLALIFVLIRRMRNYRSNINLDDLLIDPLTERISKAAVVLMGSWVMATWVIIYLTITGKFDDTAFAAYLAAFATPAVVKIITDARAPLVQPKELP